jgi:hypothetical protein
MARAAALAAVLFVALLANGRPIGAGDTAAMEHLAASLAGDGDVFLDEFPEVVDPFGRTVNGRRVSIYPPLSAFLAAPAFALAGSFFRLDGAGGALVGKACAAALVALAGGVLALALERRAHSPRLAAACAALFVLGTSAWSVAQALWQHPAALLFLSAALYCLVRAEDDDRWAARAGLPLGLALAARHADVAVVAVLAAATAVRFPRRIGGLALFAAPAALFQLAYGAIAFGSPLGHGFGGAASRFSAAWSESLPGLLASPGHGLLVFTPLAAVAVAGAALALRRDRARWLAAAALGAGLAHLLLVASWNEWHGGDSFGPRLLSGLLPPLCLFLPDGLRAWPRLGAAAAVVSVAVQALGAFAYDHRWHRLHRDDFAVAVWSWRDGPLAFQWREGVVILARPRLEGDRVVIDELRRTPFGPRGGAVAVEAGRLWASGAPLLSDLHLTRAARLEGDEIVLSHKRDAVGFRTAGVRGLVLEGSGDGPLYVRESRPWGAPRWTSYPTAGPFRIEHRLGPDPRASEVAITTAQGGATLRLTSIAARRSGARVHDKE